MTARKSSETGSQWLRQRLADFEQTLEDTRIAFQKMEEVMQALVSAASGGEEPILDVVARFVSDRQELLTACPAVVTAGSYVRGEVYLLAREQGATLREIEERSGLSRATVLSLMRRARDARRE